MNEVRDKKWSPIQQCIEASYNDIPSIVNEIDKISLGLKENGAEILYYNYKKLDESRCINEELKSYDYLNESDESYIRFKHYLLLKSLSISLAKKDLNCLVGQIFKYYKKGIKYYVSWSIMLCILINIHNKKFDHNVTDLLLDIEINNYYGIKILEESLKEYWHKFQKL